MKATAKIFRFNPQKDASGHYEEFSYEMSGGENILDVLIGVIPNSG